MMILPRPVHPGEQLRMIAVSGTVHEGDQAQAVQKAREKIESLGYPVIIDESCYERYGYLTGTDEARARTLENAFLDPDSAGIICFKGGFGCIRMVDLVDWERIRKHPKAFVGYSDITTLHLAMQKLGLASFHGPMGTSPLLKGRARESFVHALAGDAGRISNPDGSAFKCLVSGRAEGCLMGGNLSLLSAACGTAYFPDLGGAVLFIEEIGEYVYAVDRMLHQLELSGNLAHLSGLLLGAFTKCEPEHPDSFTLEEVIRPWAERLHIPVLAGVQAGHVDQPLTLPLGRRIRMDAERGEVEVLEE